MRVLDLFSGIGGFSLGLERAGMETAAFCEIEEYPRKVLKKHWPDVPIYDDIRELTGDRLKADGITADLICGGYPCQPFSTAGKRQGEEDDRHLWPEMYRLIKTLRPRWVIAENVAGHISMGLDAVLSDLEAEDYAWWPFIIPACAVDAKHRRDRVWIIAHDAESTCRECYPEQNKRQEQEFREGISGTYVANASERRFSGSEKRQDQLQGRAETISTSETVSNTAQQLRNGARNTGAPRWREFADPCRWKPEPGMGRVANGVPDKTHRLFGLGGAVVPQIPEIIGRAIMEIESNAINH